MTQKNCPKCSITKPLSHYGKNKSRPDGMQRICKDCMKTVQQKSYVNNKEKHISRNKTYNVSHRKQLSNMFEKYKSNHSCAKCGDTRGYILDFHHIDPLTKENEVSNLVYSKGWEYALGEIEKCIMLCKNCHADFHHWERKKKINIKEYLNSNLN